MAPLSTRVLGFRVKVSSLRFRDCRGATGVRAEGVEGEWGLGSLGFGVEGLSCGRLGGGGSDW